MPGTFGKFAERREQVTLVEMDSLQEDGLENLLTKPEVKLHSAQ